MNITLLAYLESGEERPDIVVEQATEALTSAGHKASLLTVHDEHDLSIPTAKRKAGAEQKLRKVLETFDGKECPVHCRVPIRTDINFGVNWWEACK